MLRHLSEEEATPKQTATSPNGAATQDGLFRHNLTLDDTNEMLKMAEVKLARLVRKRQSVPSTCLVRTVLIPGSETNLASKLEGGSTHYIWGVLDIVPVIDFPDIRMRCAVHSANSGSVMVIPREHKLVRFVQPADNNREAWRGCQPSRSLEDQPSDYLGISTKSMAPYKISYRKLDWWTAYRIGQRVGINFSAWERMVLAGDDVHTHR